MNALGNGPETATEGRKEEEYVHTLIAHLLNQTHTYLKITIISILGKLRIGHETNA
jgi:hypothetical protein